MARTQTTKTTNDEPEQTIDHQPRDIADNPLDQQMQGGDAALTDVYERRIPLALLSGPPGIGKSTLGQKVATRFGQPWQPEAPGTTVGMIDVRIAHARDAVVVLDDVDWHWKNPDAMNVLKRCTEVGRPRFLSHTVGGSRSRGRVKIEAGIIMLTNVNLSDPAHKEHVEALKERATIHVFSFDPLDAYEFTCWHCSRPGGILSNFHINLPVDGTIDGNTLTNGTQSWRLPLASANALLQHFAENARRYPSLSPRTLAKFAARYVGRDHETWLKLIEPDLLPKDKHVFRSNGKLIGQLHTYQITPSTRLRT
jgi:DNA polymerase III delta prime subunit